MPRSFRHPRHLLDSHNIANHSIPLPVDIGFAHVSSPLDTSYLPVITLRNNSTGALVEATDPRERLS